MFKSMSNSSNWPIPTLRKSGKWILLATIIGVAAYRMKLSPTRVVGHEAASGPIVAVVVGTGTLEARVKSTISARIQERLAEVLVDQNDPVKAGQLLARLDDGESRTQVELAEAMRVAAQATLQRVKTDEARAQAVARQAFLAHQRASGLLTNQISSQADFDKSVEQLNVAEADVKRSQAAIAEAESQAVAAGKTLAYQKERLTYTQIISPYDGLITRRDRDPGGVVVPGSSILQMISTNEIWVSAWVDETSAAGLLPGQPASVTFRSEPAKQYSGEVARVGRETDRETREFLVDVRIKELPRNWTIGQRAEVFIETARKEGAVVIPERFLLWRSGKPGLFINKQGRATWRGVTLGLKGRDIVEITQGLALGEQAVMPVEPKQTLSDGMRISIP